MLKNVRVSNIGKVRFSSDEEIKKAIAKAEAELGEDGRVLVRVSGTEPLVRVMLEGKDEKLIEKLCDEFAEGVRERLIYQERGTPRRRGKDMRVADKWKDYELLDCSSGQRLERWGDVIHIRPEPQDLNKTEKTQPL